MAVPWLKILDVVGGVSQVVRMARGTPPPARDPGAVPRDPTAIATANPHLPGALEATLANVVVAALKEAFDRDAQRMAHDKAREDAERERAERALRLELLRQAADREVARQRLVAGLSVLALVGTLVVALLAAPATQLARLAFALAALLHVGALAAAFQAQSRVSQALAISDLSGPPSLPSAGTPGLVAPWLVVAGLATTALIVAL